MSQIIVAYWSQTGNTEEMANLVAQGIKEGGKEAKVLPVSEVNIEDLKAADCFALGCPAMGSEELEDAEMEPLVQEVEKFASGKNIALFGSYAWAEGEWMQTWEARMLSAGAKLVGGAGVISYEAPDAEASEKCITLGKELAAL